MANCKRCQGTGLMHPRQGSLHPMCPQCNGTGIKSEKTWTIVALLLYALVTLAAIAYIYHIFFASR